MRAELVEYFLEKGFLLSPDFFKCVDSGFDGERFFRALKKRMSSTPLVLNDDLCLVLGNTEQRFDVNWMEFEKARSLVERGKESAIYDTFLDIMNYNISEDRRRVLDEIIEGVAVESDAGDAVEYGGISGGVIVLKSYNEDARKRGVDDFVSYFRQRLESLKKILSSRSELQNSISLGRVEKKKRGESVSFIGIVREKSTTKNGNIILGVEDTTGESGVLVMKNRKELIDRCGDIVLDECIGVCGVMGEKIVYCNDVFFPDIPVSHELKKAADEAYAVFTSDFHVGLKNFVYDDFLKFVKWLNGGFGSESQREVALKVKYLFIVGDLVEGIGIYPGQEDDLVIKDIYKQYEEFGRMLEMIRKDITIVICGGNHDALRMAEPQPILDRKYAEPVFNLKNVVMVSNPAIVNIHASNDFAGFEILLYHGFSFIHYADYVPSIRAAGGQDRCDLIMKFLLERRHLAPSHQSTLYVPDSNSDSLVIDRVPDFFVAGHIHRLMVGSYRNVTMINAACWATQTEDMERRGIVPDPGKVPVVNLKTREVKVMNFRSG